MGMYVSNNQLRRTRAPRVNKKGKPVSFFEHRTGVCLGVCTSFTSYLRIRILCPMDEASVRYALCKFVLAGGSQHCALRMSRCGGIRAISFTSTT
jgi:hypothetical protein